MNVKAVAFCALVMMAGPAAAEPWAPYGSGPYGPYGPGPSAGYAPVLPYRVHATLRANGLRPVTRPVQSGPYIVVRAVDSYGDVVRVLLNARYGNIVSVVPLPPAPVVGDRLYRPYGPYPYRPYEPYPRYGAVGPAAVRPDLKAEPPASAALPNGPYAVPNAQEHRSAAVTPGRPPMPRPRPAPAATASASAAAPPAAAPPAATPPAATAPVTTGTVSPRPSAQSFPPAAPLE